MYHKTGARDDPAGMRGVSALYRDLMWLGTKNLDIYDRVVFVKKWGGLINSKINYDNAIFYQVVPSAELNNALWLDSERLTSLNLTDNSINLIKENYCKQIHNTLKINLNFEANLWVRSIVFAGTVYETPEYGDPAVLRSINSTEIKKIYPKFRNPEDIILVIAGKFDIEQVKKMVAKHFSSLPKQENKKNRKYKPIGPRSEYVYKNWLLDNVPNHFLMYGIRAPSKFSNDHLLFNFIYYYLVDKRISKLEEMCNRKNDFGVTIHSEYTNNLESNVLIIKISAPNRLKLEPAKYVFTKELDALAAKPLSQSELKIVKNLMELDFKKDMSLPEKRSFFLAENYHLRGNADFEKHYLERINKISSYDILALSKKYLKKSNIVLLNVYRKKD